MNATADASPPADRVEWADTLTVATRRTRSAERIRQVQKEIGRRFERMLGAMAIDAGEGLVTLCKDGGFTEPVRRQVLSRLPLKPERDEDILRRLCREFNEYVSGGAVCARWGSLRAGAKSSVVMEVLPRAEWEPLRSRMRTVSKVPRTPGTAGRAAAPPAPAPADETAPAPQPAEAHEA
jgi:hypothetical protein